MTFIVKVPGINGLGNTKGCEKAGNLILECLKKMSCNEFDKPIEFDKFDVDEIHVDNSNVFEANKLIYKNAFEIFNEKPKSIFLGGDHSISYSLCKGFLDSCVNERKELCLIVFDAHADLMSSIKEPTHEEWLRKLIEDGFPVENILLVGVRNLDKQELDFINENKIKRININSIKEDIDNIADTLMEFCNSRDAYVSIDIDVVDPAFVLGTGYPEVGGLSSRELIYLIQRLNKIKNLRGIDIVEINPLKDVSDIGVKLGAKIVGEVL